MSSDIDMNPGPVTYPCSVCEKSVRSNQFTFLCDIFHLRYAVNAQVFQPQHIEPIKNKTPFSGAALDAWHEMPYSDCSITDSSIIAPCIPPCWTQHQNSHTHLVLCLVILTLDQFMLCT